MSAKSLKEVIHCRAAILWKEGQPLTVENITVDPPKANEVRVRMVSAGICATDAHFIWGQDTDLTLPLNDHPLILGHEGAAIVESVGEDVTSVAVGDHVLPLFMPNCEKCQLCVDNPKTNMCLSDNYITTLYHKDGESRMHFDGKPLLSLCGISSFSEYSVIRETQIAKITPEANLINSCMIGCAVGTGFGSVTNIAQVHSGASVAVWGLGAIGLSAIMACKHVGAKRIIGIDINPDKFAIAAQLGCTELLNPNDPETSISEVFKRDGGIDYAFDCIGDESVLNIATQLLNPWGTLTLVGLPHRGLKIKFPVLNFLTGTKVCGGLFGNQKSRKAVLNLVNMYANGELDVDPLISHRFKLDQINEAFDLLKSGKVIRAIIEYH